MGKKSHKDSEDPKLTATSKTKKKPKLKHSDDSLLPTPASSSSSSSSSSCLSSDTKVNLLLSLSEQDPEQRQQWWINEMPSSLLLRDEDLVQDVLDLDLQTLDDMIEYFCLEERLGDDEFVCSGPFKYEYDQGDCFDWYLALGCVNCGRRYDQHYFHHSQILQPKALVCLACGHRACPRHEEEESDCLVERMEGLHLRGQQKLSKPGVNMEFENEEEQETGFSTVHRKSSSGIYLYGRRTQHNFGQFDKSWWQDHFLSQEFRDGRMMHHLRVVTTMGQKKGVTCQEECLLCGHDRAFYQVYQARSADEGMTIMFECCQCRNRKVFNN